jgi:hypothetical protein
VARNEHIILVGISLGKRALGRPRKEEDNIIAMDLMKKNCKNGRWMEMAQDLVHW